MTAPVDTTTCCIAGCGPVRAMSGLLRAGAGVGVLLPQQRTPAREGVTAIADFTGPPRPVGIAGWRAHLLPRWDFGLPVLRVVPLSVGALAAPGIDLRGAVVVGAGHIGLGLAMWSEPEVAS